MYTLNVTIVDYYIPMQNHQTTVSALSFLAKSAGLTFTLRTADVSTPAKYLAAIIGLSPICKENIPIGSFPKFTSTEKLN